MTPIVQLRPLVADDAAMVFEWRNRPDIARNMYQSEPIQWEDHKRWIGRIVTSKDHRYWVVEFSGKAAGLASIQMIEPTHRRCLLGLYIADEGARLRGVGAAAEFLLLERAFGELGLHKVYCEVIAFNETAVSMHKRFGFHVDGVLRDHVWRDDRFYNSIALSLLETEWPERRGELARVLTRLVE